MTDLDVICRRKAVGILSVMKDIATEYIENESNPTSHNVLSIPGKVWDQSIVISTSFVRLTNIPVKSITTIVIKIKHILLQRQQIWCVTKHK
jgi:hypothetical protein